MTKLWLLKNGVVEYVAPTKVDGAKWLGVPKHYLSRSKVVRGYLVVTNGFPYWEPGYILTDRDKEFLGLPVEQVVVPRCSICSSPSTSRYCKACDGVHILVLGSYKKVKPYLPITDGINTYSSVKEAAESIGGANRTTISAIYRTLVGQKVSYKGISWSWVRP